jgi:hypothetical protein
MTDDVYAQGSDFVAKLLSIPQRVVNNVPAFFGFAAANYAALVVLSMIPQVGGVVGMVESAGVYGALKVVDHATWDAFNSPYTGASGEGGM